MGKYHQFVIYEPKIRTIKALPYIDRIIHQWYIEEFIKPYFVPKLIFSTFACISDRGTHKAVAQIQKYMRIYKRNYGDFWILKCKYYVRYMDDFIILLKTKQECIEVKETHTNNNRFSFRIKVK